MLFSATLPQRPTRSRRFSFVRQVWATHVTAKNKAYCLMNVAGVPRRLFSLSEMRDESVIVLTTSAGTVGAEFGPEHQDKTILNQKYTVHTSRGSTEGVNTISYQIVFGGGHEYREAHLTASIKTHNRFAPVCFIRCPDLSLEKYTQSKPVFIKLVLGSYDPRLTSLVYGLFVGARRQPFTVSETEHLGCGHLDLGEFRIVVLWALALIPSGPTATRIRIVTQQPEGMTDAETGAALREMQGLDPQGCERVFWSAADDLCDAYWRRMMSEEPPAL